MASHTAKAFEAPESLDNKAKNLGAKRKTKTPLKAIREFCLKCLGGPKAVKECPSTDCPLHTLRFGKNPNHTKTLTDKERKRRSDLARKSFF